MSRLKRFLSGVLLIWLASAATVVAQRGTYPDGVTAGTAIAQGLRVVQVAQPSAPTVTPQGTTGATSYSYGITAITQLGETNVSANGSTATGNATLSAMNFNRVTWTAVTNAEGYKIYRTASGGTPATTGLIGTVGRNLLTFDDTGIAAGAAAPTINTTGAIVAGVDGVGAIGLSGGVGGGRFNSIFVTNRNESNTFVINPSTSGYLWFCCPDRTLIRSPADGELTFLNTAETGFTRVNLGGITSGFPGLARSTTGMRQQLANGTAGGFFATSGLLIQDVDARTIADTGDANPATLTLTPTASYVEITCNDPNTCDITMGETGMVEGTLLVIVNVSTNVVDFADSAGVSELAGPFAAGQWDTLTLRYTGGEWVEQDRSDN